MSLIKCNECGREISDSAVKCPNCGYININNTELAPTYLKVICFIIPIIGFIIFAINIKYKPKYAKQCLIASILSIICIIILSIIWVKLTTPTVGIIRRR